MISPVLVVVSAVPVKKKPYEASIKDKGVMYWLISM
jgi:hypothetical protein